MDDSETSKNGIKKYIWIILGVILLVILVLLILFLNSDKQNSSIITECENLNNEELKASCYIQVAIQKQDLSKCEEIGKRWLNAEETCYAEFSIANKDASGCEKLKETHKDACYTQVALNTNNAELCEKIQNRAITDIGKGEFSNYDECYSKIAEKRNDPLLCEKVLGNNRKNFCYTKIATTINDETICKSISGEYSTSYLSQCYILIAGAKKDSSICNNILEQATKEQCYERVAVSAKSITECNKLSDGHIVAQKEYIPENAGETRFLGPTESCYENVISESKNPAVCKEIISDYLKENCFTQTAFLTENPLVCENNDDISKKRKCYHESTIDLILNRNVTISMCASIIDTIAKDDCYYSLAFYKKDSSICENIETESTSK